MVVDGDADTGGEGDDDENTANSPKNAVTAAVSAANKERRKPFFRRVSHLSRSLLHVCLSLCSKGEGGSSRLRRGGFPPVGKFGE